MIPNDNRDRDDRSAESRSVLTRRQAIATGVASGIAVLAGCSSGNNNTITSTTSSATDTAADTATDTATDTAADTATDTPAGTTEPAETTEGPVTREQPSGEADIEFTTPEIISEYGEDYELSPIYTEFIVENIGDAASGSLFLELEWIDNNGEVYGRNNFVRVFTIGPGEQALIRREPPRARTDPPEEGKIADVSLADRTLQTAAPTYPVGLEVNEDSVSFSGSQYTMSGAAVSTQNAELDPFVVRGKVYNPDGMIVGTGITAKPIEDHGADEDLEFKGSTAQVQQSLELGDGEELGEADAFLDTRY